ncbi:MAG TPA: hypothetical protein VE007_13280 [Thermoanaerobaculia bacterium]|nr:hypothetical protein [Thermoanaerobaculia bacterium]
MSSNPTPARTPDVVPAEPPRRPQTNQSEKKPRFVIKIAHSIPC